ncbi:MAG: hypothetical protein IJT75_06035 [Bacteroidaceae bacterium]|nr:hypothetical protein [Bacteroidaceae bacterium]
MRQMKLWMFASILTVCGAVSVNAQTRQGGWFSSAWLGASWSTFAGDIEDAKGRIGIAANGEIGYNMTDWFAPPSD